MKTSTKFIVLAAAIAAVAPALVAAFLGNGGRYGNGYGYGPRYNNNQRPAQQADHIWMLEQVDKKPVLKKGATQPVYPPDLLKKKQAGSATIAFVVTKKGEVEGAKVVKQTDRAFGKAALAAIKQWHYKPAKKKGAAVACQIAVPINFTIQKNGAGASDSPTGTDDSSDDSDNSAAAASPGAPDAAAGAGAGADAAGASASGDAASAENSGGDSSQSDSE